MGFMDRASQVHATMHLRVHGRGVTYRRAADGTTETIQVVKGNSQREQSGDRGGLLNVVKSDDVHVRTSDFETAFGVGVRPADGDTIEMVGRSYRVRPLGGEPGWRYTDQGQSMLRIHLKDEGPIT